MHVHVTTNAQMERPVGGAGVTGRCVCVTTIHFLPVIIRIAGQVRKLAGC